MTVPDVLSRVRQGLLATAVVVGASCADGSNLANPGLDAAKGGPGGPTVQSVDPPWGRQGAANVAVAITGSGYSPGATASWERAGVPYSGIEVVSTTYNSSTSLTAVINISPTADLAFYDVAVISGGRKGIGAEKYEVTQATPIVGTEIGYAVNDFGQAVGRVGVPGAFFYEPQAARLDTLGSPGRGHDLSDDGVTVVGGYTFNASTAEAYVYRRVSGSWQRTLLPKTAGTWAVARSVASDPTSGAAVLIGGIEAIPNVESKLQRKAILWTLTGGVWSRVALPRSSASGDDNLMDVTAAGVGVGAMNAGSAKIRAVVWEPGVSGWTLMTIGAAGSKANAINRAGTRIVGYTGSAAAYWEWSGSTWGGPIILPGSCAEATGIDDLGRISANGCAKGSKNAAAVLGYPYSAGSIIYLGGLGDAASTNTVQGISRVGGWLTGQAVLNGTATAVRWQVP